MINMNKKFPKCCDVTVSKAANGFIITCPPYAPLKSVIEGKPINGIEISPLKPYVFESLKNMQEFIKNHFNEKSS